MDFNIGDIVRAKDGAPYAITTNGWTGRVKENHGYYIVVKNGNESYSVDPNFFRASSRKEGGNKNGCKRNHY